LILGSTGTGKTTYLSSLLRAEPRLIAIDPKGEDDGALKWLPLVSTMYDAGRIVLHEPTFQFRVHLTEPDIQFEAMLELAKHARNVTVAIDEVHRFAPNVFLKISPRLKHLILEGRTLDVRLYATSQSPRNVHKDLLGEAADKQLVIFRTTMKEDLARVSAYLPADAKPARLKNFEALIVRPPDYLEEVRTTLP